MIDSKLIKLLKTFSSEEMKEFEKFAASPYFNKGRNYIPLLKVLKKFYPEFDSETLTPEYIYSKLNPASVYNPGSLKILMSGLCSLAINFTGQLNYDNN